MTLKAKHVLFGIRILETNDKKLKRTIRELEKKGERVSRSELIDTLISAFYASESATPENFQVMLREKRKGALKEHVKSGTGFILKNQPAPLAHSEKRPIPGINRQ